MDISIVKGAWHTFPGTVTCGVPVCLWCCSWHLVPHALCNLLFSLVILYHFLTVFDDWIVESVVHISMRNSCFRIECNMYTIYFTKTDLQRLVVRFHGNLWRAGWVRWDQVPKSGEAACPSPPTHPHFLQYKKTVETMYPQLFVFSWCRYINYHQSSPRPRCKHETFDK